MDSKQGLVYRRSLLAEFFRGAIMGRVKTATSWEGSHPFFAELSGDMCYHLNSTHLDVAKEELAKFHVIGLQERFDASLVWAAFELKWSPSELVYDRKVCGEGRRALPTLKRESQSSRQTCSRVTL